MAEDGASPGNTGDGTGDQAPFLETLGDHGTNEIFKDIADAPGLAGKTIELNTALEELRSNQPAIPENVDGYVYEPADGDIEIPESNMTALREFALEKKWSPETFSQALEIEQQISKGLVDAHNAEIEKKETTLKTELGEDYEPGKVLVQKALTKFGGDGIKDRVNDLAGDPDIFKLTLAFAKSISPDVLENVDIGTGGGGGTKSAADVLFDGK